LENPGADERMLQHISEKQGGRRGQDWCGSGYGQV